jgi:hypothetical protein
MSCLVGWLVSAFLCCKLVQTRLRVLSVHIHFTFALTLAAPKPSCTYAHTAPTGYVVGLQSPGKPRSPAPIKTIEKRGKLQNLEISRQIRLTGWWVLTSSQGLLGCMDLSGVSSALRQQVSRYTVAPVTRLITWQAPPGTSADQGQRPRPMRMMANGMCLSAAVDVQNVLN